MIIGKPLTSSELADQLTYLDGTPVGRWIRATYRRFSWSHAELVIPADLFGLRTLWSTWHGRGQKQLVNEVGRMVAAGTYADLVLQAKILSYAEGIAAGPFDLILTLVEDSQGILIADGNARCVALYVLTVEKGIALRRASIPVVLAALPARTGFSMKQSDGDRPAAH